MVRKKCRPQKLSGNVVKSTSSDCPRFLKPEKLFELNLKSITNSLMHTMIVCGIHYCKATNTKDIIVSVFNHYNERRHARNCERSPTKLCKRNILSCLAKTCLMSLVEAQLTYYILKYTLKAYFNRIPQDCIDNPVMDLQLLCEQETAWRNAAKRIIKVYAECEGIMQPLVYKYKDEIIGIYLGLFEQLKENAEPQMLLLHYDKVAVPTTNTEKLPEKVIEFKETPVASSKTVREEHVFAKFRKCCNCKFPLELCDCNVDPKSGKVCMDCSQGPFICEWYRMDKEHRVKAKDHVCPIDCESDDDSLQSEDVCNCDLEQLSDCEFSETCSEEQTDFEAQPICVEDSESDDDNIEPKMEGCCYCCHMPICNRNVTMERDKPPKQVIPDSHGQIFVESQILPPPKVIKNVRLPPEVPKKQKKLEPKKLDKHDNNNKDKNKEKKDITDRGPKIEDILIPDVRDRKSHFAPVTKIADELAKPPVIINDEADKETVEKVVTTTDDDTGKYDDKEEKPAKDGDDIEHGDDVKKHDDDKKIVHKRTDGATGKTKVRRKLPCCKCPIEKPKPKCKKCLRCRPAFIPKNRLVPAPILC